MIVVIPAYQPDEKLLKTVGEILEQTDYAVVVVDDGSAPERQTYFEQLPDSVTVLHHEVNRGKGAALKTAFTWFLANRSDGLGTVTVDGDNQHHPADTRACCEHMLTTGRITLGCRDFSQPQVPPRSRFGNRCTSAVFRLFCGIRLSDTQTGLRAFPRDTLSFLTEVSGDRFEYETNMLLEMKNRNIPFDEVSIRTVYIEENKSSHFHVLRDSWRIYRLILGHFFRYTASSLFCAAIDSGAFALLSALLSGMLHGAALTAAATGIARLCSSVLNFFINKKLVFHSEESTGSAMLRYYALAVPQLIAQFLLTQGVCALLHIPDTATGLRTLWYVLVMVVLYFVGFTIQRRWVFASGNKHPE